MTVYLMESLQTTPYMHRMYTVLANPIATAYRVAKTAIVLCAKEKEKTTQAAKHSLHQLRNRRHIGPMRRESHPPNSEDGHYTCPQKTLEIPCADDLVRISVMCVGGCVCVRMCVCVLARIQTIQASNKEQRNEIPLCSRVKALYASNAPGVKAMLMV